MLKACHTCRSERAPSASQHPFSHSISSVHSTLPNVTPPLTSRNPRERMFALLVVTFPSHMPWVLTIQYSTKEFKPHTRTHHVVIIVLVVIIAMLTLCYSITSHVTLILFYHAFMLILHNSLIITCTLVVTSMILRSVECIFKSYS